MPLLNYTTQIAVEKTIAEIQLKLSMAGASSVLIEYDGKRVLSAVSFQMKYQEAMVSFRLPAKLDKIQAVLHRDSDVPRKLKTREQAARVAWRIIKVWIEAQLAIVEAEQAEMVEVFLPYAQSPASGETVFDSMVRTKFKLLKHQ